MYYPTLEEVKKRKGEGTLIPVYREIVADLETPVSAFLKINRSGNSFLLESVDGGEPPFVPILPAVRATDRDNPASAQAGDQ